MYYKKLTENRKRFVNQLIPLIESTFDRESDEEERIKTISIDASWGMGKTLLKDVLVEKLGENGIRVKAINAWETDYFSDPMKSLIGEINESDLNISSDTIEKGEKLIKNIGGVATKIFGTALLKKLNFTDEDIINIKSIFQGIDSSGVEEYKKYKDLVKNFKESFGVGVGTSKRVIILDELDRCKPNYAIELLEAIKHIFDIYNLTFIFLINKEQLKYTVENLYGCNRENEDYFEKFFDLQLILPEIDISDFLQIEYENYKYTKEALIKDGELNFEIFMKALLIKILETKYKEIKIKSIRQIRKILNKFTCLLKTFTEEEKRSLILITNFISYFLYKEFYNEINRDNTIFGINIVYFFRDIISNEKINSGYRIEALDSFYNNECLFEVESIVLLSTLATLDTKVRKVVIINQNNLISEKLKYPLFNQKFNFNQIKILCDGNVIGIPLSLNFINEFKEQSIFKWCEEKYEFTYYID
ncbi:P-loop NTPase fold protein [uncultured Cetobacterium sp.]|uniref:KAP family P-loop NTPase fold protein n=1 Tax=uncultured Cetobacterium sp. TaxID=527638 RepID=UPI002623CD39|nr:P-loop NTPase fold protein [uncultured Cetobacterium sp.]